jgi:5'-nucleotidase
MQKRIAIDMDEVVADAISRYLEWYERDFGLRLSLTDLHGKKPRHVVPPEHYERVRDYPMQKGFFRDLPVIEDSIEVIRELNERFDVFFVTAAMQFPLSLPEKFDWIETHFPFISWERRIFCGRKDMIDADYLIDDHEFNLKSFKGQGIIFTSPHNVHVTGYPRANNWQEVREMMEGWEDLET